MKHLLIPIVVVMACLAGCSGPTTAEEIAASVDKPVPLSIRVAPAEMRQVEQSINVTGSLDADEEVVLGPEVAGRLAAVHVDFGQSVRKGQVIAELDKRELELRLAQARASFAQALARIGLGPDQADVVPQDTPMMRQAQAQLDNARTQYESAVSLVKTGDIAQERYVALEKAYNAAEAALDASRHDLRTSLASIQALRAQVGLADKALEDATVRAPFDGAVTERMASPGEYLQMNAPIVRLVKSWPLRLRVDVPEPAAPAVHPGTEVSFATAAIPGETFSARVTEVSPSLDARSRSLSAEARLTARDARLRPGMFVQIRLVTRSDAEVMAVPKEAVQVVAGLSKVFVIRDGRAVELRVYPGQEVDGWIEVREADIQPGESVAVTSLAQLVDGAPVTTTGS